MNLEPLRTGEESFDQFARRTRGEWEALARYCCRRVAPSRLLGLDDVVQELMIECWQAVKRWDPARGSDLGRYCIFGAVARVTRKLKGHGRKRCALGDARGKRGELPSDEAFRGYEASPEELLMIRQAFWTNRRERAFVLALAEQGGAKAAASYFLQDPRRGQALGVWTRHAAMVEANAAKRRVFEALA